jgi:Pyridoxal-dependent decarboxylase, pyridoxal binding domain
MTTYSLDRTPPLLPGEPPTRDMRAYEAVVLRRCAMYRKAFRGVAISYPAEALCLYPVARWIRSHGVTVDVGSVDELRRAGAAGILVPQIVMHCNGVTTPVLHCAVNIGVGRFVVDSMNQVSSLATGMGRMRQVVVDTSASDAEHLAEAVAEQRRLNLIGFHHRLTEADDAVEAIGAIMARMWLYRREHPVVLTRISLAGFDGGDDPRRLRHIAAMIDDAVEDACIRFHCPRSSVTIAPTRTALLLDAELAG